MKYFKKKTLNNLEPLKAKFELYKSLSVKQLDEFGWLDEDVAHSLQLTSLYYTATNHWGDPLPFAQNFAGMFYRHPRYVNVPLEELGLDSPGISTISRDMFMGVIHYIVSHKREDILNDILTYCHDNYGIMGLYKKFPNEKGKQKILDTCNKYIPVFMAKPFEKLVSWIAQHAAITAVNMSPGLYFTLRGIRCYLRNKSPNFWLSLPVGFSKGLTGYQANLTVLHIACRAEIRGYATQKEMNVLKDIADRYPKHALYQAVYHLYLDGNQCKSIDFLSNEQYFPSDRLPEAKDRAFPWLWDSETHHWEWKPDTLHECTWTGMDKSNKKRTWTGVDFLISYYFIKD